MDSLTHLAIGACMGEALAGKKLGRKAMLLGALAQSIPDLDFISSLWTDTATGLLAHRGFTHSILFGSCITPLFAFIAERWHRRHLIRFREWLVFFGAALFVHLFIDVFNNYGVGWFEPFSHQRLSFNAIYVADPFFSLWPVIGALVLTVKRPRRPGRSKWWRFGLGMSALYLLYCTYNKSRIDHETRMILDKQQIAYTRYFTTPAPLQNWLWFVVAGNDSGYHVGFRSVFDKGRTIAFQYFPRNTYLLQPVAGHEDLQQLIRFSQQFYTIEKWGDTLVFNDLRFGQIIGWEQPRGRFVFQYYLQQPKANALVVQRGRFEGWNRRSFLALWKRIQGE